jgi:Circularly permutated YpsA SLOG family
MPSLVIISGGQSGVDRAALDEAIARGMVYGGWCPHGGWAEDSPAPPGLLARYPQLRETPSADPAQRTEWNVRDSDASLILVDAGGVAVSGGTALAQRLTARYGKPLLVLDADATGAPEAAREWLSGLLTRHDGAAPFRLAIGGPRESEAPGIYVKARVVLAALLGGVPPAR